ncbi:MAG: hypothetical protein GXY37_03695 [Chloroflexi bacterium]|nr:hypothetical protein [Chloroflexota bacterium]
MSPEIINLIKQIKHPLPSHCARQLPPRGSLAELFRRISPDLPDTSLVGMGVVTPTPTCWNTT